MYNLINKDVMFTRGVKVSTDVRRLVGIHAQNVRKQIAFYQQNYETVSGTNPLIRLAYSLSAARIEEPIKLYHHARQMINDLISPLGFTNDVHQGNVSYDLYKNIPTVVLATDKTNPAEMILGSEGYEKLAPLKVIHIPTPQDNLVRPDLAEHPFGYAVMELDVPLFALSLGQWQQAQVKVPLDKRESIEMFIGKYVLPNAMYSQADCYPLALCDSMNDEFSTSTFKVFVPDVGKELWADLHDFMDTFNKASTIEDNLKALPAVFKETQFDVLRFPRRFVPIQEYWGHLAAFLRPIQVGLKLAPDNQDGRKVKNMWNREYKKIQIDGTLRKIKDDTLSTEVEINLINIQTIIDTY